MADEDKEMRVDKHQSGGDSWGDTKPPKDVDHWERTDHRDSRKRDDDYHRSATRRTDRRSRSRSRSRSPGRRASHRSRSKSRSPRERRRSRSPTRRDADRDRADRHRDRSRSRDHAGRDNVKERSENGVSDGARADSRATLPRTSYGGRPRVDDPVRRQVNREVAAQEASKRSIKENRVYVGNLAFSVKWSDLKDFMREIGNVVFAEVMLLPNGMSKGCGVVEFSTREEAEKAIREVNDTPLFGRPVFVREDREDEARYGSLAVSAYGSGRGGYGGAPGGRGGFGGSGGSFAAGAAGGHAAQNSGKQLAVSGLPYNVGWQDLKDMFRSAGNIVRADVHYAPDGSPTGNGIVAFDSARDAQNAIAMFNGFEYEGRTMEVREDRSAPPVSAGFRGGFRGGFGGRGGFGSSGRGGFGGRGGFAGGASGARDTNNLYGDYSGQESPQNGAPGQGGFGQSAPYSGRGGFSGGFGGRGFGGGASIPPSQQIFVKNLPWSTSNEDLVELFQTTGKVNHAEVLYEGGRSKGVGVIEFETQAEAEVAIAKFQNYSYGGRPLSIEYNARWRDFNAGPPSASFSHSKMQE